MNVFDCLMGSAREREPHLARPDVYRCSSVLCWKAHFKIYIYVYKCVLNVFVSSFISEQAKESRVFRI